MWEAGCGRPGANAEWVPAGELPEKGRSVGWCSFLITKQEAS